MQIPRGKFFQRRLRGPKDFLQTERTARLIDCGWGGGVHCVPRCAGAAAPPPQSTKCLCCLIQLATLRRSFFTSDGQGHGGHSWGWTIPNTFVPLRPAFGRMSDQPLPPPPESRATPQERPHPRALSHDERKGWLQLLLTGTLTVLQRQQGLTDPDNYYEFCRCGPRPPPPGPAGRTGGRGGGGGTDTIDPEAPAANTMPSASRGWFSYTAEAKVARAPFPILLPPTGIRAATGSPPPPAPECPPPRAPQPPLAHQAQLPALGTCERGPSPLCLLPNCPI